MAKYSENGRLVATDDDEGLSPVAALRAAMAEQARREEQGIRLLPQGVSQVAPGRKRK